MLTPFKTLLLAVTLAATGCQTGSKTNCSATKALEKGFLNGKRGASNQSTAVFAKCSKKKNLVQIYNQKYSEGLLFFCTHQRGFSQAEYGLPKESVCTYVEDYKKGHQDFLNKHCTTLKAKEDAKSLLKNDNSECLNIASYKKTYSFHLQKNCSYKRGQELGLAKKNIDMICNQIKNRKDFVLGYKKGLSLFYKKDNKVIKQEISKIKKQRESVKIKFARAKRKREIDKIQKYRIELNVLESKILNLEHQFEENKKRI